MELNTSFHLRDKGVSNALSTGKLPRHRWYFVKEGFSPSLVEHALVTERVRKGALVIDPFAGGGTTTLAASMSGMKTVGVEVNPFLRYLSAAKMSQANPQSLLESATSIESGLRHPEPSPLESFSTFGENNRWGRWLFSRAVLRSFEGAMNRLPAVPDRHRALLKLALLSAAMACCNASRDGKCLRYRKDWKDRTYSEQDLIAAFRSRIAVIVEDLRTTPLREADARILLGDARHVLQNGPIQGFRLCIASPPYLNSFDYSDVYRPEMFLGRFVDSNAALMRVRLKTIRSHVQAKWRAPSTSNFGGLFEDCILRLKEQKSHLWNARLPLMIQAYFEDMRSVLQTLRTRAGEKSSVWLVVSTSAYAGVEIPVDFILAEIGQECGWYLREIGVLRYLRSSGQQMNGLAAGDRASVPLRESVVVFQFKPPGSHRTANAHSPEDRSRVRQGSDGAAVVMSCGQAIGGAEHV